MWLLPGRRSASISSSAAGPLPGPSFEAKASFVPSSPAAIARPKFAPGVASHARTVSVTSTTRKLRAWTSAPATFAIGVASTVGSAPPASDHAEVTVCTVRSPALETFVA